MFRMAQLDLFSLQLSVQRDPRRGDAAQHSLLALPNVTSREVSSRICREAGPAARTASVAAGAAAGDLGARRLGWRGTGDCRFGRGTPAPLSAA